MSKKITPENTVVLTETIIRGIQEKKGHDIVSIDLREIHNAVCDFFVICHGDSDRQVSAIANAVEDETREQLGEKPWHREGLENSEWVLLDYVSVVVHIFHKDAREFYSLEKLWADAKIEAIPAEV